MVSEASMGNITPVLHFFKPSSANFFYKSRSFCGIKTTPKANKIDDIRRIAPQWDESDPQFYAIAAIQARRDGGGYVRTQCARAQPRSGVRLISPRRKPCGLEWVLPTKPRRGATSARAHYSDWRFALRRFPPAFRHGGHCLKTCQGTRISRQLRALTNSDRCPTFSVATMASCSKACAARMTSQSNSFRSAVGRPRRRAVAQNSAALNITDVVIGTNVKTSLSSSSRWIDFFLP